MQESAPSKTAELVCFFRALERRRKSGRIVDDPHAHLFLGRSLKAALRAAEAAGPLSEIPARFLPGLATFVIARHRFIDDALTQALSVTGADRFAQVVLLGAGYDTRAYRFAEQLAGRPVFEVDFPSTGRRKDDLVRKNAKDLPGSVVRRVEVDFLSETFDGPLLRAGFMKGARTFFVWEGVSMYLTRAAVKQTISLMRALGGPGSELCCDFWFLLDAPDLRAAAHRLSASLLQLLGEPVLFGIHPEDAPPFLQGLGFDVVDTGTPAALAQRYVTDRRDVYGAMYVAHARARG
ncbi:MAG TPA: SAM-dependent methyltransferase [Myxococcota bacterium]